MKNGSEPEETADYWEERQQIEKQMKQLDIVQDRLVRLAQDSKSKRPQIATIDKNIQKNSNEIPALEKALKELTRVQAEVDDKVNEAFDARDETADIQKAMAECGIPVNIQVRRNEVNALMARLDTIKNEFKDLKQADADYDGSAKSEGEMKALIAQIEEVLAGFNKEGRELKRF